MISFDFNIWYLVYIAIGITGITLYFTTGLHYKVRKAFQKDKVEVIILKDLGDTYKEIHRDIRSYTEATFSYGDDTYTHDLTKAVIKRKGRPKVYYEEGKAQPLGFKDKSKGSSAILKTTLRSEAFKQMLGSEVDRIFILLIIVMAVGMVCLGIYSIYTQSSLNKEIMKLAKELAQYTTGVIS